MKIVFDPGAHNLVRSKPRLFAEIVDLCNVFCPNLDEASAITNVTSVDDIVSKLRDRVPLTALKCGEDGCILIGKKNTLKLSGFRSKCLDPTGAGDAFTAALVYGLARELPLEVTGKLANWFASQMIKGLGPRSFPAKSRINRFLRRLTEKTTIH